MYRSTTVFLIIFLLLGQLAVAGMWDAQRPPKPVMYTGMEDRNIQYNDRSLRPWRNTLDDIEFGTTYQDYQKNGTFNKQVAVDAFGKVHHVWTNGVDSLITIRHVFYNIWDPDSSGFIYPGGIQADASTRAGFASVVVDGDGCAYPAFHQIISTNPHSAGAIDFVCALGAFTVSEIPYVGSAQVIWPALAIDINGDLHTANTESEGEEAEYYSQGTPIFDADGYGLDIEWERFEPLPSATFITYDIAASWHTERIAVAYLEDPEGDFVDTDVYIMVSEDAGRNWGAPINITNFTAGYDTNCVRNGGTIDECNQDTLRAWLDCSIIFDNEDNIHVAFSTWKWFVWDDDGNIGPWILVARPSVIWHWDEIHQEYNLVAEAWYAPPVEHGVNHLMCHRPNLAIDTTTGYLYCSYQQFDSVQSTLSGFPQADAYVTVSTDGGRFWAVGTNVTNTDGGVDTPAGECMIERDINLATFVTDGIIHMQYLLDRDGGSSVHEEGVATLNPMLYKRIPVGDIPTTPLLPARPMHYDSSGYPAAVDDQRPGLMPDKFTLYQNYPNPFNASTKIQFDLRTTDRVTLKVYDITGREVAVLLNNEPLAAGTQILSFNAEGLPSGVYLYRLKTSAYTGTRKMMLIR